jgi:hypothetical protein
MAPLTGKGSPSKSQQKETSKNSSAKTHQQEAISKAG